jgi:predicted dehydrogenase
MLKIGIVGAENTHCPSIAKLCNVEKAVEARVVAVWGETREFAESAAKTGEIPSIVNDWRDMAGQVDGVMIDHRHAGPHAEAATYFVKKGVPCFVDKPFTFTLAEGKRLCALARRKGVPITSFSTVVLQQNFGQFKEAVGKIGTVVNFATAGPCDLKSKYGGVFFYGIHQVDPIIELFGTGVDRVYVKPHAKGGVAVLTYKSGPLVTLSFVNNGNHKFHWTAIGDKEIVAWPHTNDESVYLKGARLFTEMFASGKDPFAHERFLAPVAVLEAMAKSLRTATWAKVGKV